MHSIFSGPVITAAIGLPAPIATSLLQQHINQTFEGQPGFTPVPVPHPVQVVTQPPANMVQPQMMQGQVSKIKIVYEPTTYAEPSDKFLHKRNFI